MKPRLVERDAVRVARMRYIGPHGAPIGRFWMQVFNPWRYANGLRHAVTYGVIHDDERKTPLEILRYDTCVEIPDDFAGDGKAVIESIAGGRYAVSRFDGMATEIGAARDAMVCDWLAASGMALDRRPFLERYAKSFRVDAKTGAFRCELLLPVAGP